MVEVRDRTSGPTTTTTVAPASDDTGTGMELGSTLAAESPRAWATSVAALTAPPTGYTWVADTVVNALDGFNVGNPLPVKKAATDAAAPLVLVPLATSTWMVDGGMLVATVLVGRVVVVEDRTVVLGPDPGVLGDVVGDVPDPPDALEPAGATAARVAEGMSSAPSTTAAMTSTHPRTTPERSRGPNMSANSESEVPVTRLAARSPG